MNNLWRWASAMTEVTCWVLFGGVAANNGPPSVALLAVTGAGIARVVYLGFLASKIRSEFQGDFTGVLLGTHVIVPKEPLPGLLISMALRHDHSFLAPQQDYGPLGMHGHTFDARLSALTSMKQLHDEVVGLGFYKPARDDAYVADFERAQRYPANVRKDGPGADPLRELRK